MHTRQDIDPPCSHGKIRDGACPGMVIPYIGSRLQVFDRCEKWLPSGADTTWAKLLLVSVAIDKGVETDREDTALGK